MQDLLPIKVYCQRHVTQDDVRLLIAGEKYELTGFMSCKHCKAFYVRVDVLSDNYSRGIIRCYKCGKEIAFDGCYPLPSNLFCSSYMFKDDNGEGIEELQLAVIHYDNRDIVENESFLNDQ